MAKTVGMGYSEEAKTANLEKEIMQLQDRIYELEAELEAMKAQHAEVPAEPKPVKTK